jgi:hypothetical protein
MHSIESKLVTPQAPHEELVTPAYSRLATCWAETRAQLFTRNWDDFQRLHGPALAGFSKREVESGNISLIGSYRDIDPLIVAETLARLERVNDGSSVSILEIGAGQSLRTQSDDVGAPWLARITKSTLKDRVDVTVTDIDRLELNPSIESYFGLRAIAQVDFRHLGEIFQGERFDLIISRHLHPNADLWKIATSGSQILNAGGAMILHRDLTGSSLTSESVWSEAIIAGMLQSTQTDLQAVITALDQRLNVTRFFHFDPGTQNFGGLTDSPFACR